MAVDDQVERVGRWTAGRISRRGFFGRLGKVGVMVAGGSTIATLLSEHADARVCGQSGISPLCADYDCYDTLGWCWYAVGCCAGGELKKICDCCAPVNNVHGYCPSGTNVKCVLESCGTDPRVQTTPVTRIASDDREAVARIVRQVRFPAGTSTAVVVPEGDVAALGVATALSAAVGGAVVPIPASGPRAIEEKVLADLGVATAVLVGALDAAVDVALGGLGIATERAGVAVEPDVLSAEVAQWQLQRYSSSQVVAVDGDADRTTLGIAAALAASLRCPLVLGAHGAVAAERAIWAVGDAATELVALAPGSRHTGGATPRALAAAVAAAHPTPLQRFTAAPESSTSVLELAALGVPVVLHSPGELVGVQPVLDRRDEEAPGRAYLAGVAGTLTTPSYRLFQSYLNGYGVHLLRGVPGEGLPVISQPYAERPVGLARPGDSPPPPSPPPPSWLGWGA